MTTWTWAAASSRGTSHIRSNTRRQDAFSCFVVQGDHPVLVTLVADGAGSASMGGQGASIACRTIHSLVRGFDFRLSMLPSEDLIHTWLCHSRNQIAKVAESRSLSMRDFATTLIMVCSSGQETLAVHIGDGGAVIQDENTLDWLSLSWPAHGEYASTTNFLTEEPEAVVRIARYDNPICSLAVFTDGLERLALDMAAEQPHRAFFDGMIKPIATSPCSGKDLALSQKLTTYLDTEKVNSRTDDDKTIVLAANR